MNTTTMKFSVMGENHKEIVSKTEKELSKYLDTEEDISKKVNYEIIIEKDIDEQRSSLYTAQVIAKVRNGY